MIAAVVFDMYGTLLRIEGVRERVAEAGAGDPDAFVAAWRRKQLEYSFLCSLAQAYEDFDTLTALALEHTCASFGLPLAAAARARLAAAWLTLPAHPDAAPALRALRERGVATAVLTNGKRDSAGAVLAHAGLRELFDDVLSAEPARVYKPDPRVYAIATRRFACEPAAIVFVSSNPWDAWGGARFGFRVAWCKRGAALAETLTPAPEATLGGLAELPAFVTG